jgi:2-keto-3-deoxy-L-rhamnonate aldolase RhmA
MSDNPVTRAIAAGKLPLGAMMYEFDTPGIMRILRGAGAEFVIFDLEHTGWDAGTMRTLLATGRGTDVFPIVRVIRAHYHLIASALDAGAKGVMVPMVESGAEARLVVESMKYPPVGRRGFGVVYSDDLAEGPPNVVERANRETLAIVQIESTAGIENADDIIGTDGVDIIWLGHFDLSISLGVPGAFDHPKFTAAVEHLQAACRSHGKPLGQMITTQEEGLSLRERGFQILAYGDIWLFEQALRERLDALRG